MMRRLALLAIVAVGCGARTDLDRGPPRQADGGPDVFIYDSFPCRWSLGESVDVARGRAIRELTGAVHPIRDQLVVMANVNRERVGARIALSNTPEVIELLEGHHGELFSGANGWLRQIDGACAIVEHDDDFAEGATTFYGESMLCSVTQTEVGRLESLPADAPRDLAFSIAYPGPSVEALGTFEGSREGVVVRDPERGFVAVYRPFDGVRVDRVLASGERESVDLFPAGTPSAAPDRVWQRTMLLYGDGLAWRLAHIDWDGPLRVEPHAGLTTLPPPVGRLRANESEALVPLSDGTMASFPLPNAPVRFVGPVEPDGQVELMEIILRPGQSAGGLLYVHREPSGAVLRFRTLVCNR